MPNNSAHENAEVVELDNQYAIVEIPENCVELTLQCKVVINGELQTVMRTMDLKAIREAFEEYKFAEECGYIPPNAVFTLTDAGKQYAEELMRNGG